MSGAELNEEKQKEEEKANHGKEKAEKASKEAQPEMPSAAHPNPFLNHIENKERGSSKLASEVNNTPAFIGDTVEEERKGHDPGKKTGHLTPDTANNK